MNIPQIVSLKFNIRVQSFQHLQDQLENRRKSPNRLDVCSSSFEMFLTLGLLLTTARFFKRLANVKHTQRIPLSGFPRSLELFVLSRFPDTRLLAAASLSLFELAPRRTLPQKLQIRSANRGIVRKENIQIDLFRTSSLLQRSVSLSDFPIKLRIYRMKIGQKVHSSIICEILAIISPA